METLKDILEIEHSGKKGFQNNTEFKFIAGWTVSILPHEYGEYEYLEREGKELLRQANQDQPDDKIFKMVYLGSFNSDNEEYRQAELEASPVVLNRFQGPGLLNRYFRQILNRNKTKR